MKPKVHFDTCCTTPHVTGKEVVRKSFIERLVCLHSWAVHEPLDQTWICLKCGARRYGGEDG